MFSPLNRRNWFLSPHCISHHGLCFRLYISLRGNSHKLIHVQTIVHHNGIHDDVLSSIVHLIVRLNALLQILMI